MKTSTVGTILFFITALNAAGAPMLKVEKSFGFLWIIKYTNVRVYQGDAKKALATKSLWYFWAGYQDKFASGDLKMSVNVIANGKSVDTPQTLAWTDAKKNVSSLQAKDFNFGECSDKQISSAKFDKGAWEDKVYKMDLIVDCGDKTPTPTPEKNDKKDKEDSTIQNESVHDVVKSAINKDKLSEHGEADSNKMIGELKSNIKEKYLKDLPSNGVNKMDSEDHEEESSLQKNESLKRPINQQPVDSFKTDSKFEEEEDTSSLSNPMMDKVTNKLQGKAIANLVGKEVLETAENKLKTSSAQREESLDQKSSEIDDQVAQKSSHIYEKMDMGNKVVPNNKESESMDSYEEIQDSPRKSVIDNKIIL